jgi:hypothetical protein
MSQSDDKTHEINDKSSHECETSTDNNGISFHWDKDEELRLLCNGTVYIHPHLSTVTYLTDGGDYAAPTFIAEHVRVNNLTGEWIENDTIRDPTTTTSSLASAFISWPFQGKHLCFDGRYLHAAPSNLLNQSKKLVPIMESTNNDPSFIIRRKRRYTFLVNIWMYHRPFNVHPFPESMIDKLSGSKNHPKSSIRLVMNQEDSKQTREKAKCCTNVTNVAVLSDSTVQISENDTKPYIISTKVKQFVWPMGDQTSNESIHVSIPIDILHSEQNHGGNVRIHWNNSTTSNIGNNHNSTTTSSSLFTTGMFLRKEPIVEICNTSKDHDTINDNATVENDFEKCTKRARCTDETDRSEKKL